MKNLITNCLWATILFSSALFVSADDEKAVKPTPEPFQIITGHKGKFGGKSVSYQAIVGNSLLKRGDGTVYAEAVITSYIANDAGPLRPVTFVFNGGPGSASVWLHMGLMGPKRVRVPSDAADAGLAPYRIEDNSLALLDVSDLVFIDPTGTGFSRLAGDGKAEDVYGLEEDARSVAQIVREWVRVNGRWNAPKFIAGESFGTTRAAAMLPYLQGGSEPMRMNGVIMISQAMDYTGSTPVHNNLIAHVTYLPSLAATARYHGQLANQSDDLQTFLAEVRAFAFDEYLPALFKGAALPAADFDRIAKKLVGYTGLSESYVKRANLRILTGRFAKELLRDSGEVVGRLDARYRAPDLDMVGENARFDAASAAISGAYSSAFRHYVRHDLNVALDRPYYGSGPEVNANWVYDRSEGYNEPSYVNTAPQLAAAMKLNPALKVMVASGIYDLVTPFFDAEYTLARHGIEMERVAMTYYEAGHMMYVNEDAYTRLSKDMRDFIVGSLAAKQAISNGNK